jgi:DNA-binding NtrC family response regulator
MPRILIVDDESSVRNSLKEILEFEKYEVDIAVDGEDALKTLKNEEYDLVLCDIKMPKIDGMEVLEKAMQLYPDIKFIMISGHGNVDTAIEAVKKGAFDYIPKPPDLNKLLITIKNALDVKELSEETKILKSKIKRANDIIGESNSILKIKETILKVAPTEARVLITGENGTGKELVAQWIHQNSHRAKGPFIELNCAAIPSELIESELFGHEKGAFTSAVKDKKGKFELASGGTLFLDEIGDMSASAQAKVLRALQENVIQKVGGEKDVKVNCRVLAATNKDLRKEIAEGRFREDLYHRLAVILIHVPSLNDRKDDIPMLAEHFLTLICQEHGIVKKSFSAKALKALQNVDWTGNIRELRNIVERLVILCGSEIQENDISIYANPKHQA